MIDNPNKRKLFNNLVQDGLYTKSYEEFSNKYSTPESQVKLHQGLVQDGLYTKSTEDFNAQYFSEVLPNEKKNPIQKDMELSVEKPSMDTNQEEDGWLSKIYSGVSGVAKNIIDTVPLIAKGITRLSSSGYSAGVGTPSMDIAAEIRGEDVKRKTKEELATGSSEVVDDLIPYQRQKLAKGTSSISELISKDHITSGDIENVSYQVADGLVQMGVGAIPIFGNMLLYSKNFEQRFEDAKSKGISDHRAYGESAAGALIETVIEKQFGVDKLISKGLGKAVSKEAIKDISGALLSREAFQETAKKYAKSLSFEGIKQGFNKGFLPEAIGEFTQTYIDGAEQDLFDFYERKRKEGEANAKLSLYDPKEEEGVFNTVNPQTGEADLSLSFKSKTLSGALDAAFYGGITGQMGASFVDSRSFNPSIYATLQNSYDSQGKEGLVSAVDKVKNGLNKASETNKLDVDSYNNAIKNVDKIASNISKFEQNSDINSYSRFVLYDHTERIIPETANRIARTLAESMVSMEMPTQDQISDDIKNNDISVVAFQQENQVPPAYKPYVSVIESGDGVKSIEATIPNSVVEAYNTNQMAVQEQMNNPLFAINSLTNNNEIVTIEDINRIGQQGGRANGDLSQQLNFNIIFEANKNNTIKSLQIINYAKSVANKIASGQDVEASDIRKGYANIYSYNKGDTVFYNNKSAKIMDISPSGQGLKLSGIQEEVSANDDKLRLQDSITEQAIKVETESKIQQFDSVPEEDTTLAMPQIQEERPSLSEQEQITDRTMRNAVDDLIPFTYQGETGEIYMQGNGVVVFESPNRIYEFGNIKDIGDRSIDEFDIVPQEMSIEDDYSVNIDGKKFTNKNQNPFGAVTYDTEGNVKSIKLENDNGQTRVIKGTRATVIEAKYKVKKLYDESTREQLAAAADDAANQAAIIKETRRQPTGATSRTESKVIEQAPSITERERINSVIDIAKRLAAEETEQMSENRKAVANLASSLYTAGIPIEVMNSEAIRIKYGENVEQGMFISKDGTIVLNESILPLEWGKTIIFHEGVHPIINIIRNVEPSLYKKLVAAAKEEAKNNPIVNEILQQINVNPAYGDEFTRNDELVVELIARVASGKLDISKVEPSFKQAVVDFINKIAKAIGLNPILKDSNQVALNKLADQIASVLNEGRDISEIVGSKNTDKYKSDISVLQFSDISRDDKRIQIIRRDFSDAPKADIVSALTGEPFNLSTERAEELVKQAFYDHLSPSLPTGKPSSAIPEGAKINNKSETVSKYNSGYNKAKKALLESTSKRWDAVKKYIALQYDSKFYARRALGMASSEASLAQAKLRNLNGIAYSTSQDLAQFYEDIFGNGLSEAGIETLDAVIFNLRILQLDKNTEVKYQEEVARLTSEFRAANAKSPSDKELGKIQSKARTAIPIQGHGKTGDGILATSKTATSFLNSLREELGENEYNMLKERSDMFRKVGNEQVEKLRKAGIISNETAASYKDDFYALRMTLDRLYGEEDHSITILNGVPSIKGWTALSKTGTENYISQDARLMLAQSYIGTARAISKNAFRESVFNENIKINQNGNQQSVTGVSGQKLSFIKPAEYIRDANGNIRSNGKELSVRNPSEGFVNVPFKKDGVVNYFQMDKEMFNQVEGNNVVWIDKKETRSIGSVYYNITDFANRLLTGFATRKNPFFWIGNIPMDLSQQVFFSDIWTDGNIVNSNVYSAGARAMARTMTFSNLLGRNNELVDKTLAEFTAAGGMMDRMSTMKEQHQRSIDLSVSEGKKNTKGSWLAKKIKAATIGMNDRTEIAMRLAAYDQSKKNIIKRFMEDNNGESPNEPQMLKIQEIAAAKARGYTDFAQRGTSLPNLNVAYLNSSIQAAGAAFEYAYDNPSATAAKVSQLVVGKFLGTMALIAAMGDAYDDIDEYRKDTYSFLFSLDTGKKDKNGKPIFVTADIRNNPSLVPILGVTRDMAERTMRAIQGKTQEDITTLGTADRFIDLLNQATIGLIPNITSVEASKQSSLRLIAKHTLLNAGIKAFMGYDAFRGKDIESQRDQELSPYMRGQDDPNIPYFYKVMAKSMSNFSSENQVSPVKMQAVSETFITSPKTNFFVALGYGMLSEVANFVIPAKTEAEKGDSGLSYGKVIKSVTSRIATFTDSEKTAFRKDEQLYKMSKEESMRFSDQERIVDNKLKELYKKDSVNFFDNVDRMAKEEGYFDNDFFMNRIDRKAKALDNNEFDKTFVKQDILNEVKILHYTKGVEGKAKLLKYMYENDSDKVRQTVDGLIDYGTSKKEAYGAEDLYNASMKIK